MRPPGHPVSRRGNGRFTRAFRWPACSASAGTTPAARCAMPAAASTTVTVKQPAPARSAAPSRPPDGVFWFARCAFRFARSLSPCVGSWPPAWRWEMAELVRVETDGAVATIRLDRPPMNALNARVQDEIAAAADRLTRDDAIRAGVIYGGEKVFAAGADIKEMAELSYAQIAAHSARLQAALTAVAKIPKPVVAAITGYALGGGL